ncbi:MAG: hypothetical protein J3R72DRAFT_503302, partial [Linnemannia gamsii]
MGPDGQSPPKAPVCGTTTSRALWIAYCQVRQIRAPQGQVVRDGSCCCWCHEVGGSGGIKDSRGQDPYRTVCMGKRMFPFWLQLGLAAYGIAATACPEGPRTRVFGSVSRRVPDFYDVSYLRCGWSVNEIGETVNPCLRLFDVSEVDSSGCGRGAQHCACWRATWAPRVSWFYRRHGKFSNRDHCRFLHLHVLILLNEICAGGGGCDGVVHYLVLNDRLVLRFHLRVVFCPGCLLLTSRLHGGSVGGWFQWT